MRSSKLHRLLSITKLNAFQHRLCVSDDNLPSRQHHFECFEFNMKKSNVLSDKKEHLSTFSWAANCISTFYVIQHLLMRNAAGVCNSDAET